MEHTKGLWEATTRAKNMVDVHVQNKSIASVALWSYGQPGSDIENEANAEFIIRAVNSHEELVKTAKMFRAVLLGELTCEPHFLEKLEAAIVRAESK